MECTIELHSSFSLKYLADALVRETEVLEKIPFGERKDWAISDATIEIAEKFEQVARNIREHCIINAMTVTVQEE